MSMGSRAYARIAYVARPAGFAGGARLLMRRTGIEALYRRPRTTKPEPSHKSIRICCAAWRSRGRTRSGRWTSLTSRWRVALFISPSCSTGRPDGFCPGGYRSRWRRPLSSRPWRMLWLATAGPTPSTPIRARNYRLGPHRHAHQPRHRTS